MYNSFLTISKYVSNILVMPYAIKSYVHKINIQDPMGMKQPWGILSIITSIQEAILFQYGRYYKQQDLQFPSLLK